MTDSTAPATNTPFRAGLRTLYYLRAAFAVLWGVTLIVASPPVGGILTFLVVVYPLVDAASVLWQLRSEGREQASRVPEWINVVVSVVAAGALGWASTVSIGAVLGVFGAWAIASGIVQLIAAVLRRRLGGQVPIILSGALSTLAGSAFVAQSFQAAASASGPGGYAIVGAIFFLIAAIRLTVLARRSS